MILTKECSISKFSGFYRKSNTNNTIKLLVGNETFCVNEMILSWWSDQYVKLLEQDEPVIFLQDFTGHSKQVDDCLALLHGMEVDVNLDDVIVIAKFADKFEIRQLNEEIECWFGKSVNQDNLLDIILTVSYISQLKLSVASNLSDIIRNYFFKNLSNSVEIITSEPLEINSFMLDLLLDEDTLFSTFFPVILSKLDGEDSYWEFFIKLEQLAHSKLDLLLRNESWFQKLTDQILELQNCDQTFWKKYLKLVKSIFMNKPNTSYTVSINQMPPFQSWRCYTTYDMKLLRENKNLSESDYFMIFLDWVEHRNPCEDDVRELLNHVHDYFVFWITQNSQSFTTKYQNLIPDMLSEPVCRYKVEQWSCIGVGYVGYIPGYLLSTYIANNTPFILNKPLGTKCEIVECQSMSNHGFNIQLNVSDNDRLQIEIIPDPQQYKVFHDHTATYNYTNWFITVSQFNIMLPIFTKSYVEINKFLNTTNVVCVCCILSKK